MYLHFNIQWILFINATIKREQVLIVYAVINHRTSDKLTAPTTYCRVIIINNFTTTFYGFLCIMESLSPSQMLLFVHWLRVYKIYLKLSHTYFIRITNTFTHVTQHAHTNPLLYGAVYDFNYSQTYLPSL